METKLSTLIRRCLKRHSISRAEFVRKMGYQNLSKGHQRLTSWLRGTASPTGDQPKRIASATGLPLERVVNAILSDQNLCRERRSRQRALDPNYYLIVRMMACVYPQYTLPRGIDEHTALTLARARARNLKRRCCLNTPDGSNYWIDASGDVYHVDFDRPPTMRIGKREFKLPLS